MQRRTSQPAQHRAAMSLSDWSSLVHNVWSMGSPRWHLGWSRCALLLIGQDAGAEQSAVEVGAGFPVVRSTLATLCYRGLQWTSMRFMWFIRSKSAVEPFEPLEPNETALWVSIERPHWWGFSARPMYLRC
jgi:hypothetical protein